MHWPVNLLIMPLLKDVSLIFEFIRRSTIRTWRKSKNYSLLWYWSARRRTELSESAQITDLYLPEWCLSGEIRRGEWLSPRLSSPNSAGNMITTTSFSQWRLLIQVRDQGGNNKINVFFWNPKILCRGNYTLLKYSCDGSSISPTRSWAI